MFLYLCFKSYLYVLDNDLLSELSSVQSLNRVQLSATPWTAARQASLSITNSQSLLKLMSLELVMPSNCLIFCHPLLLPSVIPSVKIISQLENPQHFPMSQFFASGGQSFGVSDSAAVLPVNIQDWFSLGLAGWIFLQSEGLSSLLQHHGSKASILYQNTFSDIFSQSVACLILSTMSFVEHFLILMKFSLSVSILYILPLVL